MQTMTHESHLEEAAGHMRAFAERTGVTSERPPDRYLWTDAFAVCNLLGLARGSGEERYMEWARRLVDQVHEVLGRHREEEDRERWLSGLEGEEARAHPTRGGLRIGKPLPERTRDEPAERRSEWDRDGQYFHYNTKWMHALDTMARATGEGHYNRWARELAEASYEGFVFRPSENGRPRMYWKMRTDLSGPLVESMGQHDPIDGYVTCRQLRSTAAENFGEETSELAEVIGAFAAAIPGTVSTTRDPLGLGGLLMDAHREARMVEEGAEGDVELLSQLLAAADQGLRQYATDSQLRAAAGQRLAFRELGLAIGLEAVERMMDIAATSESSFPDNSLRYGRLQALTEYLEVRNDIVSFWQTPVHREVEAWTGHEDINQVMLATALSPEGFLGN